LLIDSLAIQLSSIVAYKTGSTGNPLNNQADVIAALHSMLTSCGWTSSDLFPSGTITYFLGIPTVSGATTTPKVPVGCGSPFITRGGTKFILYDAGHETPIPDGDGCVFVPIGTTPTDTLDNLESALTGGVWLASWTNKPGGGYFLTTTALVAGGTLNFTKFVADGAWGVAGEISGGGYIFTSVSEPHTSQYTVKVTASGQINPITRKSTTPVILDFETTFNTFGNGNSVFYLDADRVVPAPGYQIVANPYSFAVWMAGQTSIFSAPPYVPDDFQAAFALLAVYPTLTNHTFWSNGATGWLDNSPQSYLPSQYPRMLALRSPGGTPLKTPTGAPLITTAWVMYGKDFTSTPAVVGRFWDCAIANDQVNGAVIGGKKYIALASQDGSGGQTRSSLLFRIDN
jgi:hypothetical protein